MLYWWCAVQTPRRLTLSELALFVAEQGIEPEDVYTSELFLIAVSDSIDCVYAIQAEEAQRGTKWLA